MESNSAEIYRLLSDNHTKMKDIKVTIGVPVYGVEKYISKCAESLFSQSYNNIEYIFVDDCSQDNSCSIIMQVLEKYPDRKEKVHIIKHKYNRGLGAARNTAVDNATGDFITWVDSDDWIDPTMVEKMVNKQQEDNADIVTVNTLLDWGNTQTLYKQPSGNLSSRDWLLVLLKRERKTMIWSRLIRLSLYKDHNIRVLEGCNMSEDHQVIPRLAYYAKKMSLVEEPLYIYNKSNDNAYTANFSADKACQILRGHQLLMDFFSDKDEELKKALSIGLAKQLCDLALQSCRSSDYIFYEQQLRDKLKGIPHWCYDFIPWTLKIVFFIKNPRLIALYSKLGHKIRHFNN